MKKRPNIKRHFNPLAAALIIVAASSLVIGYCIMRPQYATETLIIYLCTIVCATLILALSTYIYKSKRTSIDEKDITKIIEDLNTEMIIWSDNFSYVFINKKLRDLLGITADRSDKKEAVWTAFGINSPDESALMKIAGSNSYESSFRNPKGTLVSIAWSTSPVKKYRKQSVYLSTGFNLTELKKMRVNLASANDFFHSSMELAEIGLIMSTDRKIFRASPELMRMLGLKTGTININEFRSLVHPNDRIQFDGAVRSEDLSEIKNIEIRLRSADGSYRWYSYRFKSIAGTGNTLPLFGGAVIDVTQEHEKDVLIERLAYIDEVTDIANRNKLVGTGQEIYDSCKVLGYSFWMIVLDIDRFHIINDTIGYNNGNYVLKNFAHILYKFVTPGGLAARISGDNFALLLRDYGDDEMPTRTVKSIQEEFAKLAVEELASISLTCSAGYSKMPEDGSSFLDVMEHAEFALKSSDGTQGSVCGYEPSMHDSIIGNTELEKSLALAIDNNELQLFYQPKIDLGTGKIMGVEALIRWIKPDGTIVKPDAFVPIAESSHLIGRISEFVLNEGCRQNKLWQKMGYPSIVMSINFASSDFYQTDLKDKVFEALARSGLDPQWLEVELTETLALSDIDFAVDQMNKLRDLGVKLAMDDFGTGYSSLSYLQILPITLLKLDRSFITDIEHDNIAYEIVSAVIRIAKSKKIETIAEGIENNVQESILRMAGCDYAQGYLYGKPMPPEKIQEYFDMDEKREISQKKR
ncbi:putative bifunctional diguanylate cyclase/phosphodiesterase [Ruminococcus flavefaciens]|uniref:PAS domain S-box-containing protein/diguanylate cyclase (GGDEF)-like protein n=2 Tax=Ruminococcus flavefaciens TaxID=1265 RepID=A0A315Y4Z9_RUMFL|nr:GGDEF domain-containing protein [Ruminococcus flavefaciens]PWJ14109.1 PAS domain S-box-containing protein/diguanylate cyclase (GGDEF)-like protein [Ruminococcus flavefaciens]SSA43793.1 PAS domain S-box-containing protein/diguanylate cyclase (GGDEF) domain-containing protein [Ruminococcus flavefaciens]